jgi:hypothetical protein
VLLAARSRVERAEPKPPPASELLVLSPEGGAWQARSYSDPDSRVFHKAIGYTPAVGAPGVITIGGLGAAVKLWRVRAGGLAPAETLWQARFGGRVDRMRDVEAGDLFGDGGAALAVATHDQGVIAVLRPRGRSFEVRELERRANTWVHEVELGDIDGDGVLELYATPSEPNRLGIPQGGEVVRFVAGRAEWRRVVATFAGRHAKEILLADLDDDGRDELYVSVEAVTGGRAEIRRYRAETPPDAGELVAALPDAMCRFLVAGDLDGDRRRELVIAARDSGVWLARPRPTLPWRLESIDRESGGFEHAALIADLDVNGRDELYVASDQHQELRRYEWVRGRQRREVIWRGAASEHVVTWSLGAAPRTLVEAEGAPSPRTAAARLPDTRGQWRLRSTPPSEPP